MNRSFPIVGLWLALVACDKAAQDPIEQSQRAVTPADVTRISKAHLDLHMRSAWEALRALEGSAIADQLDLDVELPDDPAEESGEITDEVLTRLFDEATVEPGAEGQVVYRLSAAKVCAEAPAPSVDDDCARAVNSVPLRLVVWAPAADVLTIALEVGDARLRPVTLTLASERAVSEVDLAAARAAFALLAPSLELDPQDFGFEALGRVQASLLRLSQDRYAVEVSVLSDVRFSGQLEEGTISLSVAARSAPIASITLDGAADSAEAHLALGAVDLSAPSALAGEIADGDWKDALADVAPAGVFAAHLAGLSADASFTGTLDRLEIRGVGFGAESSRVSLDGADLLTLDLNASAGRRLDLSVTGGEDGLTVAVSPSLELLVATHLTRLQHPVLDIPTWLLEDQWGLRMTGAAQPAILLNTNPAEAPIDPSLPPPPPSPDLIGRILEGTLSVSAQSRPQPFSASNGQCVFTAADGNEDTHPLDAFFASACP